MPPAKSSLLPSPLQYIRAHPYSLSSRGERRPAPSSQRFHHRLFPLRLGVEAGPFPLTCCEGWRWTSSPFLPLLLQTGDSARTSLKDISSSPFTLSQLEVISLYICNNIIWRFTLNFHLYSNLVSGQSLNFKLWLLYYHSHPPSLPSGSVVMNLSAVQETQEMWIQSLGWEDPLEEEMATLSSTLAWRIPWTKEPGGLQSMQLQRVRHDRVTKHSTAYI